MQDGNVNVDGMRRECACNRVAAGDTGIVTRCQRALGFGVGWVVLIVQCGILLGVVQIASAEALVDAYKCTIACSNDTGPLKSRVVVNMDLKRETVAGTVSYFVTNCNMSVQQQLNGAWPGVGNVDLPTNVSVRGREGVLEGL